MTTPANTIKALGPYWEAIRDGAPRAERNLIELLPCSTHVGIDEAVIDEAALKRCVNLISREIVRLNGLISKYDYPVGGEYGDPRETSERWENKHAPDGCTSCGREGVIVFTPVDKKHRAGLCSWCGDFQTREGYLPTVTLLLYHHDPQKGRISQALVERELRPAREAEAKRRAKNAATKRSTRKKGTKAA